ncbi:sec7 domain-containing protein [Hirsutella rhossiliensis]|uniref:Sec7 domain-containing protein n=1 Tax=Hirsutella rhossiliensis TaxID=111463 RepID=A0A9P8SFE4_9HYPO|nr:sec7 domain-containing protein [Hirsutella rhossiliensis]KAH0959959.1 sec7 domain-containing protein [Hirsutella rhossiliensis]
MSSLKFVVSSLDAIATSKDAQRNKQLVDSAKKALDAIKEQDQLPDPELIFAPLQLATRSNNPQLTTAALDCIGKLISYSFFSLQTNGHAPQDAAAPAAPLIERAIDAICDCFQGETTAVEIQLQIVKSLLAAVLNDKIVVHGAGLLKAVRQVYNVFLLSRSTANQQVAQGTLTQMVGTVFERVKTRLHMKESRLSLGNLKHSSSNVTFDPSDAVALAGPPSHRDESPTPQSDPDSIDQPGDGAKLTLKDLEHRKSFDDSNLGDGPTMVTRLAPAKEADTDASASGQSARESSEDDDALDAEDEVYVRDAYLVFRSFCNLSTKVLSPDQLFDLRGQAMRSKLISLHLIHTLLNNNITVFTSPLSTKFYLCLSITRNGASSVDRIFDVCCEIFWLMLKYMRPSFKKEIEVFLNEIYLALLSRRNAPVTQKLCFVTILNRLCADPRALVEIYLNYDCDQTVDNIFQTIVEDLSKFSTTPVAITSTNEQIYEDLRAKTLPASEWQLKGILPPPLTVAQIVPHQESEPDFPKEYAIKRMSLEALVEALRSLVNWSASVRTDGEMLKSTGENKFSLDEVRPSIDPTASDSASRLETPLAPSTPLVEDDPDHLEKEKARKTALTKAIAQFNFKPKKGIKLLLRDGFIPGDSPEEIGNYLLKEDKLDKAQIGEFLGEGDQYNIDIMHAFVDAMEFTRKRFVDALRQFLQAFRLPGEAQKIDRFMLKFAERYVKGNPNAFANADTAYVLAYSVILLNTDQHSSKIAKRMSKEEFIKNNRGINDNADLPDEYLISIFDDIASNEIVLNSEREAAAAAGTLTSQPTGLAAGFGHALSNVGRDLQREAYVQQSEEISLRSEQLFKNLFKSQRRSATKAGPKFIPATSFKHVGSMFDVTWMSFFSALSSQMQKAHNIEVSKLCFEGMKLATRIACLFELSTPREAFVSALRNTTNLNNPQEMLAKNIEALKVLLDLGQTEGNLLRESWKDILMCISQLDRLQLITGGVDANAIPDVSQARFMPPSRADTSESRSSNHSRPSKPRQRAGTGPRGFSHEIALESRSDDFIRSVDRIFTNTANLSGDAMLHFARALTEKIVEISYYNMNRVRFEWSHIWDVFGEHFNQVGCHNNMNIVFFALDSLRQLSMRFLEIEELAGFKFQKDFLKPFELVLANSHNVTVKDLVLRCLVQMIQARGDNIRSGWRTMFGVFTVAAREPHESIVTFAYENVNQVYKDKLGVVISQGAFTDLIVCLTEFSKNMKFQKKSLAALELLKSIIPTMLRTPECPLSQQAKQADGKADASSKSQEKRKQTKTSAEEGFWFPILFAFHDVLMTGEDLEVRSNALEYFFAALVKYGGDFTPEFWDILWRQQLYPIFMVLRSRPEMTNVLNHEELSVWLSTTMIQALRNMITLFTHYFDALEYMLDRFLELLALCICQENDTIARIGSNCLQQLILKNVTKFTAEHWTKIVGAFCELFERTTAYQLFTATNMSPTASLSLPSNGFDFPTSLGSPQEAPPTVDEKSLRINGNEENGAVSDGELINRQPSPKPMDDELQSPTGTSGHPLEEFKPSSNLQQQPVVVTAARRRFFNRIISRCVLQLLMIETVNELFSNDTVYTHIPSAELLRLMGLLKRSFQFARRFNEDKELRMRLWREGFMKQPPNLLKQESGSAATYVSILFRMFADNAPERLESRPDIEAALVPLCKDIIAGYSSLAEESQHRNIMAWRPVVVDVLEGYATFPEDAFKAHIPGFYPLAVDLLSKDLSQDLRGALLVVLRRVGEVGLGIDGMTKAGEQRQDSIISDFREGSVAGDQEAAARRML